VGSKPQALNPPISIKYYIRLNLIYEKRPKVCAIFSDKEVEGKITVGKGGGG
jgi:hypothetical protein